MCFKIQWMKNKKRMYNNFKIRYIFYARNFDLLNSMKTLKFRIETEQNTLFYSFIACLLYRKLCFPIRLVKVVLPPFVLRRENH